MRFFAIIVIVGLLVTAMLLPPWTPAQEKKVATTDPPGDGPEYAKDIRPLLQTYCFQCHSQQKRKAGLDLERMADQEMAINSPEIWEQVGERLGAKEMPPAKNKQPTDEERQKILAWVQHVASVRVSCQSLTKEQLEKSTAGYTRSRRLNQTEYGNTLRDLFGVDCHAGDLLPSEGGGGEGFDNTGATLFTSPLLMEVYLKAADLVLGVVLPVADAKAEGKSDQKYDAAQLNEARKKLLAGTGAHDTPPREGARKVLGSFLPRAFRRPVADKEIDRYLAIFDKAAQRGDGFEQSLKLAFKAVLISPSFLFLTETPPDREGPYRLSQYEVASHLAYFLWASMPDDELFKLAGAGKLYDDKVLRQQVQRMIRDPRARSLADSFAVQWLGIRPLGGTIRPDAKLFPEFTDEMAADMREETILFFDSIVREDRSVLEIIDSDYTFLNEPLAALYKIKGIEGPAMRRVKLDDRHRGGVLGQASILTVTSFPHRTSPVLRGRWVLEELLGTDVPPPPPNIPVLNEKDKGPKALTLREQLEKHRSKTECAHCHTRMDPLGFGLENFDPLGRWRTEQAGKAIDSVGILPSGDKFDGPAELKKLLLDKRRPEYLRNLSRKMLGYALGREVNQVDMCVVADSVKSLEENDFHISRLLETIVVSYPFSNRYQKDTAEKRD